MKKKSPSFLKPKAKVTKTPAPLGYTSKNMLDEAIREGSHGAKMFEATKDGNK